MVYLPQPAPASLDVEGLRKYTEEQLREISRAWTELESVLGLVSGSGSGASGAAGSYIAGAVKKNYIINGAMQVSQENGAAVGTTGGYYPVDQFMVTATSAGAYTTQQVMSATPGGSPNRLRITVTVADTNTLGDALYVFHPIEGLHVADLRLGSAFAKTVTLRFGVKAPAGTYCVSLRNAAANRSYVAEYTVASGEANTDVVKSITVALDQTGTWAVDNTPGLQIFWTLVAGSGLHAAANSWVAVNAIASSNQFNFMGTNGNVFELFDVALTEGTVAPPFVMSDYASTLRDSQRYWEKVGMTMAVAPGTYNNTAWYRETKRATPVITLIVGGLNGATVGPVSFAPLDGMRQITNPSGAIDAGFSINARLPL